ncbi:hypothetical protein [Fibrobacter sp. UWB10]|uniref:hypothetical protein n=1 Tax=Fibrobacter sp. UWB10 TaxID=1896201 RepID=UPI0024B7E442|nr:hypothetical protein [Fibrobacter sp. UWB10]
MLFATQVFAAWDGSSMKEPEIQEIEGKNFYLINDEAELAWFANETNKNPGARLNINAKLNADLDMNHKLWIPMAAGTGKVAFEGIIDGDGHVISNLYINSDEVAAVKKEFAQNLGFVGVLGNGSVKNIVFENVDIVTSTNAGSILSSKTNQISVGAVVGWLADKNPGGVVSACYVSGSIHATGDGQGIGGIVGNGKNGTIEHCLSAVTILAEGNDAFVGGIIGITKATLSVKSCVYDGEGLTNLGNGVTGAVVGNHISGALTTSNNYYDEDLSGIGNGSESGNTKVDLVNAEGIACALNDGEMLDGYCSVASPWSVGEKSLALNGYGAATISVLTVKVTQYGAVKITEYPDKTVAEINGSYMGPDTVKIEKDILVDQVVFNRTFNVNKMSSMMMPFSIDTANVSGAVIYEFKEVTHVDDVWKVKVRKAAAILANTPYMVLPKATNITFNIETPVIFNTTVKTEKNLSTGSWEFKGVYAYTTFENDPDLGRIYGFAATESDGVKVGQFVKVGSGAWSPAMRAYLVHHGATVAAKTRGSLEYFGLDNPLEIDIEFVDDNNNVVETGMLNTVTGEIRMDRWFDLNGRKLNAKPTTRGTYYHNGKREIIK